MIFYALVTVAIVYIIGLWILDEDIRNSKKTPEE